MKTEKQIKEHLEDEYKKMKHQLNASRDRWMDAILKGDTKTINEEHDLKLWLTCKMTFTNQIIDFINS